MKRNYIFTLIVANLAGLLGVGCMLANAPIPVPVVPESDAVFTATREITILTVAPDGTLWAGTPGGVLRRDDNGQWRKFTRLDGLPAHEVQSIAFNEAGEVEVLLPRAVTVWRGEKWISRDSPAPPPNAPQPIRAIWQNWEVEATTAHLRLRESGGQWKDIALPSSNGTHISALLPRDGVLWAAMFGDGLWSFDGQQWSRTEIVLPHNAREITALAEHNGVLWIGTRRSGIWSFDGKDWSRHLESDEPFEHNAQALAMFRGELWMSTLEDGLAIKTQRGWKHVMPPVISSNAPRHLTEFRGRLYVRHGTGQVDAFDGEKWQKDTLSHLPRKKVFALESDVQKLYAAQWGGWSEWDGREWQHFLTLPELQGLPLMALYPADNRLWLGTQKRGIGEYLYKDGVLRWHDERDGLPDDWITAFSDVNGVIFTGTFVGGLARRDQAKWTSFKLLEGRNVTDLKPDGSGGLFIATRHGVHHWRDGGLQDVETDFIAPEAQALLRVPDGLWIGTRTGLFFVREY